MGTPQVVLTKEISLWEDSGTKDESLGLVETKQKILEILSKVLNESQYLWLDLVLYTAGRGSTGPFVNKVFIFGKREVIFRNLQKIVEKIATKKELKKGEVWVGFNSLENFGKTKD